MLLLVEENSISFFFFICSEFCHTLEWNSHGFTCVPHPDPPSHLPLHLLPLGFPSAPGPSACLMHPTWAGDLLHPRYHTCFDAQSLSRVWLFGTPWTAARQASLSITNSQSLLKLMSIELVMPFSHLILCHPLLLLPSIFPTIRVFSSE